MHVGIVAISQNFSSYNALISNPDDVGKCEVCQEFVDHFIILKPEVYKQWNCACNSLGIDIDIASHPSSLGSNSIIWNVYKPTLPIISWAIELIFGILVQVVFWWYWHSIGAAQLLIHHLVISAALYRSIIWTFLLTSVFTSVLLFCHAAAYCKEMQKHTCHFPAIEQRNYARAWPLPGSPNAATKVIKTLSMKISPSRKAFILGIFCGEYFQAWFYDELQ